MPGIRATTTTTTTTVVTTTHSVGIGGSGGAGEREPLLGGGGQALHQNGNGGGGCFSCWYSLFPCCFTVEEEPEDAEEGGAVGGGDEGGAVGGGDEGGAVGGGLPPVSPEEQGRRDRRDAQRQAFRVRLEQRRADEAAALAAGGPKELDIIKHNDAAYMSRASGATKDPLFLCPSHCFGGLTREEIRGLPVAYVDRPPTPLQREALQAAGWKGGGPTEKDFPRWNGKNDWNLEPHKGKWWPEKPKWLKKKWFSKK